MSPSHYTRRKKRGLALYIKRNRLFLIMAGIGLINIYYTWHVSRKLDKLP